MKKFVLISFILMFLVASVNSFAQIGSKINQSGDVLWDNGSFITHPNGGNNNADLSVLQRNSLGLQLLGITCCKSGEHGDGPVAEDFEIPSGVFWQVDSLAFYAFVNYYYTPHYFDFINTLRMRIYKGDPMDGGTVVYGDLTANLLHSGSVWDSSWRAPDSYPDSVFPIRRASVDLSGLILTEGEYWVEFWIDGGYGTNWLSTVPLTTLGQTTTGNARRHNIYTDEWTAIKDGGIYPQGIPFRVHGTEFATMENDAGIVNILSPVTGQDLTASEPITIAIKNYGTNDLNEVPFQVTWNGPSGTNTITAVYQGTIAAGQTVEYTLDESADLSVNGSYQFEICTQLVGDSYPINDCCNATVTNKFSLLWDNGPFITHPGIGPDSTDYSMQQRDSLGLNVFAITCNEYGMNGDDPVAEDFEVPAGIFWEVDNITFYPTQFGPIGNIEMVRLRIYKGDPVNGGEIFYGDLSANLLKEQVWDSSWRIPDYSPTYPVYKVSRVTVDLSGLILAEGTYWIEFWIDGYYQNSHDVRLVPITIIGQTETGNARRHILDTDEWMDIKDGEHPQGIPFLIHGSEIALTNYDAGIEGLLSPVTGFNHSATDSVTIVIKNYGTDDMNNVPYQVSWDGPGGADTISGIYEETIAAGQSISLTLSETADLSAIGDYDFEVCTLLENDSYPNNDCWTGTVTNKESSFCTDNLYTVGCNNGDGFGYWGLSNILIPYIECDGFPEWYHDFTDSIHELTAGINHTLTAGTEDNEHNYFDVWIDFNDDKILTDDELVIDDFILMGNISTPEDFDFYVPAKDTGVHLMRARTMYSSYDLNPGNGFPAVINDACETHQEGNCCDFSVHITANADDVASVSIDIPGFFEPGEIITPKATVINNGTAVQPFEVTLTIGNEYSSTKTVSNLAYGQRIQVDFDTWTTVEGDYIAEICTSLDGDVTAFNNCVEKHMGVFDKSEFAFGYCTGNYPGQNLVKGPVTFNMGQPEAVYSLRPDTVLDKYDIIEGACWAHGKWWGCTDHGGLYTIDTKTGQMNFITETIPLSGLAFDHTTNTFYGTRFTSLVLSGINELFIIDSVSGEATLVGTIGQSGPFDEMISIAFDGNGELYGYDLGNFWEGTPELYHIDKITGGSEVIGSLPIPFLFAQDMAFNKLNNTCFMTGSFYSVGLPCLTGLLEVNLETAQTTVVDYFQGHVNIAGFAIPDYLSVGVPELSDHTDDGLMVVSPNPSTGTVNIDVEEKSQITIIDNNGRLVYSGEILPGAALKTDHLGKGLYIITVITNTGKTSSKKLIVQ